MTTVEKNAIAKVLMVSVKVLFKLQFILCVVEEYIHI
jgi:hypothetical protein